MFSNSQQHCSITILEHQCARFQRGWTQIFSGLVTEAQNCWRSTHPTYTDTPTENNFTGFSVRSLSQKNWSSQAIMQHWLHDDRFSQMQHQYVMEKQKCCINITLCPPHLTNATALLCKQKAKHCILTKTLNVALPTNTKNTFVLSLGHSWTTLHSHKNWLYAPNKS